MPAIICVMNLRAAGPHENGDEAQAPRRVFRGEIMNFKGPAVAEVEKLFRLSATVRPLTEHERQQQETMTNLTRLRAERLTREMASADHA
jgi:hypothetical protein